MVPTERLPKNLLEQVMSVFMGPDGHVVCYYLRDGTLLNFVGIVETDEVSEESWTVKLPWDELKAQYRGLASGACRRIIDAADKDQCYRWSLFNRPPIREWSTRRVTLLGDAAHPTLPYLAQGAAMSIEDGAVLTRALGIRIQLLSAAALPAQPHRPHRQNRSAIERQPRTVPPALGGGDQGALRQPGRRRRPQQLALSYNPLTVELK